MKKLQPNNIKNFYAISLSFVKADTEIRGKFSFFPEFVEEFSNKINSLSDTHIFILSTCNRTELYFQTENPDYVIDIFCKQIKVDSAEFRKYITLYRREEAIKHFLRVSAGLESQIIGDFEIISQIKTWFKRFKKHNCTNAFLERLLNTGIQTSKKIKYTTSISTGITSMSYAAVHYILTHFTQLSEKKITLIGTGKIGKNTCENLIKHINNPNITVLNRTFSKAQEVAQTFNLKVANYEQMQEQVINSDIVIVATGASKPIITKKDLLSNQPITLIDLSIPSNVCLSVKEYNHIILLNVDDLSQKINETLELRNKEIPIAEVIIDEMINEFIIWSENRKYAPIIHAFKSDLERIKEHQLKTLKKDQMVVSEEETELSNRLVQKITNRLANYLITNPEKADDTINLFTEMFQLQEYKV